MKTRSSIAAAIVAVALFGTSQPSGGAEVATSGWWTAAPVPVAPDGDDALVVQGGPQPDRPVSYAAVEFTLSTDESVAGLRLNVAEGSGSTPATLTVCPLTGSFTSAGGGPMADAPAYDCTTKASAAAADGVYTFDVSSLGSDGRLAVAIVPSAPGDRVVIAQPGGDDLDTSGGGDTGTGSTFTSDPSFDTGSEFAAPSSSSSSSGAFGSSASFDVPLTETPSVEGGSTTMAGSSSAATEETAAFQPVVASEDGGRAIGPFVFVALVVLAAALWLAAGRMGAESGPTVS